MRLYLKIMLTTAVAIFWLWSVGNSLAALSSRSDVGVVIGLGGVLTSSFLSIWLLAKLYAKGRKNEANVDVGSSGGGRRG